MIKILKAAQDDAYIIHELAHLIYFPTYSSILSKDQMDFMLGKSYTVAALQESMQTDQDFYIAYNVHNKPVGFMALKDKNTQILRIEKLYLLPEAQGSGIGKELVNFAIQQGKLQNKSIIELNVNRGNKAYYFYLKVGFKVVQEVDIPYYGYILDDYIMQKEI